MKLVGIVGSNAVESYNRLLLQFIQKHFNKLIDLDIVEIDKCHYLTKVMTNSITRHSRYC